MTAYQRAAETLRAQPRRWLVTGAAGFIGSHLLETLLALGQTVTGLDDLSTGTRANLREVQDHLPAEAWSRFTLHEGTVADFETCRQAVSGAELILHQAGFVSVPRSIEHPELCDEVNVTGTLHLLLAARERALRRFVYASSSAVYGNTAPLPNVEDHLGQPLSPYGRSKLLAEQHAALATRQYGLECVGLRYFNVFGPRQSLTGGYAAVIPQWIAATLRGDPCHIHGDGLQTRDFCPVADIVQANLLAATAPTVPRPTYNVALGQSIPLHQLHTLLAPSGTPPPIHDPARPGDIRHSAADIAHLRADLGHHPTPDLAPPLAETIRWYRTHLPHQGSAGFPACG